MSHLPIPEPTGGAKAGTPAPTRPHSTVESFSPIKGGEGTARAPEGQFRLLLEYNLLPAWVIDLDSLRFLAVNQAALRHYGFTREEFLRLTVLDIHPPEDAAAVRAYLANAPAEGKHEPGLWQHRTKDGAVLAVELAWQDILFGGRRARLVLAQDVTERQRAARELAESEQRLRQLAENIRAVFWMTDAQATRLLYVSPMYEEVWGRSCDSLYQHPQSWQEAIHPDCRETAMQVFDRFGRNGHGYEQEYRVVRPDGSVRWVRDRGFPVRDLNGRVYRVAGIAEDITQQKQQEDDLRRHMRQQEVMAVLSQAALADTDVQHLLDGAAGMVAQALKADYTLVGELVPDSGVLRVRSGVGWRPGVVGARTLGPGTGSQAGYTLQTNEPVVVDDLQAERRFRGGPLLEEHGIVSGLSVPIRQPGRPFGVLAVHSGRRRNFSTEEVHFLQAVANLLAEATARQRAEEALRQSEAFSQAVLNSLAAQIAVLDRHGTIVAVNDGWKQFVPEGGGPPPGCGVGSNYLEVCRRAAAEGAADAAVVLRGLRAVLDGALPLFTHEYACPAPTEPRWFLMRATPCAGRHGCAVVAHIDITERTLAEERLRQAARHKDEFLAMLAHELRNPLAPLRNGLQILKQLGATGGSAEPVWEMMERQVQHLSRLVADLVDVSRLTRGRIELRKEVVEVGQLVRRVVETHRPLFQGRQLELIFGLPERSVWLEADPARLEQILYHLLDNAGRYSEPGGQVAIAVGHDGGEVVLRVRDTGVGIAPELLGRIFDPFVQGERRLDRSQGGVGIGLTLVKMLVELHGGRIQAASAGRGQGTEFTVWLPAPARVRPAEGAVAPQTRSPTPAPRRLLVVDDNPAAAESLAWLLRLEGHQVRIAYDGPTALDAIRADVPELVILDLGMPRMDGYEVCRRIRAEFGWKEVVVVALTGWGREEDRRRSREAGFDHHLTKPVEPEALRQLLAGRPGATGSAH